MRQKVKGHWKDWAVIGLALLFMAGIIYEVAYVRVTQLSVIEKLQQTCDKLQEHLDGNGGKNAR